MTTLINIKSLIMRSKILCALIIFFYIAASQAQQGFYIEDNAQKSNKIRFKLINNLIIIPVEVNGIELSFLLDTGVSKPIIFNYEDIKEVLKLNHTKIVYLKGLGSGEPVEAIKSEFNVVKIGNVKCKQEDFYVINSKDISFSPRLGIPVHGVIGHDVFKDFIVKVNYSAQYLRIYSPKTYKYKKCKKCETLPITVHNSKPYINSIIQQDSIEIPVKLLVDTGGSDALWLFEDDSLGIHLGNKKYFEDFLGHGLSGSVYGKRTKIRKFKLNHFELERPNVAFPDSVSILATKLVSDRNGSISGNILRRFNIIFDYPNRKMTFKKNKHFNDKFSYNKSGIELEHSGVRFLQEEVIEFDNNNPYQSSSQNDSGTQIKLERRFKLSVKPAFTVVELRNNSPAEKAGIRMGDIIIKINGKETHKMNLQEVMAKFYDDDGKVIKLIIEREGITMPFTFELESLLK